MSGKHAEDILITQHKNKWFIMQKIVLLLFLTTVVVHAAEKEKKSSIAIKNADEIAVEGRDLKNKEFTDQDKQNLLNGMLKTACGEGSKLVEDLITVGAQVNAVDKWNRPALWYAIYKAVHHHQSKESGLVLYESEQYVRNINTLVSAKADLTLVSSLRLWSGTAPFDGTHKVNSVLIEYLKQK